MGVKTQLSMISALVLVSLLLLRWTPADDYDTGRAFVTSVRGLSEASAGKAAAAAGAACKPGATPRPPVSVEWVGREAMIVSYSDKISVEVYKHDFPGSTLWLDFWDRVNQQRWEPETLWVLKYYLSKDPRSVYVDFGSWIGPTVLYAGQFASAIYSLEPDPLSFSTLNANIHLNEGVLSRTKVFHECIAPTAGLVEMAGSGESNTRMTDVLNTQFLKPGTRWKVKCRTLPQFVEEEGVDLDHLALIKMDTEGTELWLLPTLKPWLAGLKRKPAIWLSVHSPFWKEQDTPEHKAKVQLAWDVLAMFEHVYDQDLVEIFPSKMEPNNFCADFCTFLLSSEPYLGPTQITAGRKQS